MLSYTYVCVYMYCTYHLATALNSSKTVLHSFHSLELKIALRRVRSRKGGQRSIHKTIRSIQNLPEILRHLSLPAMSNVSTRLRRNDPRFALAIPAYYVLHQRPGSCCSSGQMIKHTNIIDPNSLSDMNYHDCFDSFVCFWLPVTIIYNRQKHYQQHRDLIKKWNSNITFSSCKGWSVLRISEHLQTTTFYQCWGFQVSFSGVYMTVVMFYLLFHICSQSNCCTKVSTPGR